MWGYLEINVLNDFTNIKVVCSLQANL
jgi:hypothetical protein